MIPVVILDRNPVSRELTARQLTERGYSLFTAESTSAATELISGQGASLAGLITEVDHEHYAGWDLARLAREVNADVAVGYLSAAGHSDWAFRGVPNSVMISTVVGEHDIPDTFFRQCEANAVTGHPAADETVEYRPTDAIHRELRALHEHFQRTTSFIAFLEGRDHRYTFANETYVKLVEREVVGRTVKEAFPEAMRQGFIDILDRVFKSGEEFIGHGLRFEIERDDGSIKRTLLDLVYRPIHDAHGHVCGIFVEGEDLTSTQATRAQIAALQNELIHVARVNAMGSFATTLAHELNQPLTSITNLMSAATLIAGRKSTDPEIVDCLNRASTSALRAAEIIRRLRAMTIRQPPRREIVAIDPALREAASTACTGRPDVTISFDFAATGRVLADPVQLQQVIFNLVRNAIEAANGNHADIHISTADNGAHIECCISDAGSGISEEMMPRLFESFATSKAEGMGVGLSLSKTIIEAHGGTLTARNNQDRGAAFCFTLPRASVS